AQTANYWKNRQGMIDALSKAGTAKTKAAQEAKFNTWANKAANKAKYGNLVSEINKYYASTNIKARHDNYLMQLLRTSGYAVTPGSLGNALMQYAKENEAKRAEMLPKLNDAIENFYGEFYAPLEKDVLTAQLNLYASKGAEFGLPEMVA